MVDRRLVRQLLRTALHQVAAVHRPVAERWAYENRVFVPPAPTSDDPHAIWISETLLIADESAVATGTTMMEGIYQLNCHAAKDRGTERLDDLVTALGAALPAKTAIRDENLTHQISVYRVQAKQGRDGEDAGTTVGTAWWMVPIEYWFRTYAPDP